LQGLLSSVLVKKNQEVKKNQPLFVIEAMKMETTVTATEEGIVDRVQLNGGSLVNSEDLVLVLK
jgi:pyruvate carboxylase